MNNRKLFLSAVSSELVSYRELLTGDLKRPNLDVAVQEDFVVTGGKTLEKLDTYIHHCDGVIHLIGKASGAVPEEPAVAALLAKYPDFGQRLPPLAEALRRPQPGFSYTQWEAYLALYQERQLFIIAPPISSWTHFMSRARLRSFSMPLRRNRRRNITNASARSDTIADSSATRNVSAPPCCAIWWRFFHGWNRASPFRPQSCATPLRC